MRFRKVVFDFVFAFCAAISLFGAAAFVYFQSSLLVVTSRSMEPTFKAGDTLLTTSIPTSKIGKSDVLVLPVPNLEGLRFSHRVIEVSRELTGTVIKTQGDANPTPDSWTLNITDQQVPRVVAVIPTSFIFALGHIFDNDT